MTVVEPAGDALRFRREEHAAVASLSRASLVEIDPHSERSLRP